MDNIIILAIIGSASFFILMLMLSNSLKQKCPSCGKSVDNKELVKSTTRDLTEKKSDGSNDLRYKKSLETEDIYKYTCKCGHIFNVSEFYEGEQVEKVDLVKITNEIEELEQSLNKSLQKRIEKYKKNPHLILEDGERDHMKLVFDFDIYSLFSEEEIAKIKIDKKAYLAKEDKKRKKKYKGIDTKNKKIIISFLKEENKKLPVSDIDFRCDIQNHFGNKDINYLKKLCEELYRDKKIGRTGNYRYFV